MLDELTDEQQMLHETTVRFVEAELPRSATRELHDHAAGYDPAWRARTGDLGWFSMLVPEAYGGGSVSGHGLIDATIVADSIGRFVQPGPFLTGNVVAAAVAERGTEQQRSDVLPGLASGTLAATWAPFGLSGTWDRGAGLRVTIDDGDLLVAGSRGFVSDAPSSDLLLLVGNLDGVPVQLLVTAATAGVEIVPLESLDLSRRMAEVHLDVRLPAASLLGSSTDSAADALERQLQIAVTLACAEAVGALDAMFEMTVEYSKSRIAFGRPIGSFQALKHLMADLAVYLEGCKAVAEECARVVDARADDAAEVASMAASFIDERATQIAQECLQIHGGIGFTWEHDLHLLMRRARSTTALWCDQVWHRERICQGFGL